MVVKQNKASLSASDIKKLRSMRPGMPLDLQVTTSSSAKRVRTEFIGMEGSRLLIVKFPDESKWGGLRDAIYPDASVIVRYILEDETGEIIAFKSKVLSVITKPSHMVFISFPVQIQNHGLRSDKRSLTRIPAAIYNADNSKLLREGIVMDMSYSGCRVGVEKGKDKIEDDNVTLHIENPANKSFHLKGQIKNRKADELMVFYGIKFNEDEEVIQKLCLEMMIQI